MEWKGVVASAVREDVEAGRGDSAVKEARAMT